MSYGQKFVSGQLGGIADVLKSLPYMYPTWRIIPVSKRLATAIYKA